MTEQAIATSGYVEVAEFYPKTSQKGTLLWIAKWGHVRLILTTNEQNRTPGDDRDGFTLLVNERDYSTRTVGP